MRVTEVLWCLETKTGWRCRAAGLRLAVFDFRVSSVLTAETRARSA
jgi:hypothetical protein